VPPAKEFKRYVSSPLITRFSPRKIIRGDTVDTPLGARIEGPNHAGRKHDGGPFAYTRALLLTYTHARTRDGRQVGPRTSKRSAEPLKRRRVPRCRLIYGLPRPFFPSFLSRRAPSFRRPLSIFVSVLLSPSSERYIACVCVCVCVCSARIAWHMLCGTWYTSGGDGGGRPPN